MKKAFSYDIKERIAVISRNRDGSKTLELNRISYNDRPAKLDLRRWSYEPNGDGMDARTHVDAAESAHGGLDMNIYTWFMNLRTPYLYPWGWAFVIGGAFGVGYAAGLILRLGQCAAW